MGVWILFAILLVIQVILIFLTAEQPLNTKGDAIALGVIYAFYVISMFVFRGSDTLHEAAGSVNVIAIMFIVMEIFCGMLDEL